MTEPEFSAEYILRTLGQQSANITLALATAGVGGSALGLSNTVVANTIGIGFGTVSGTQTFRDLNIEVDVYEEAEKQAKIYKAALDRGEISEYNYTMAMRDINTTLAMEKLTPSQIMNASLSNAVIEGTLTRYLGTAANSIALVKNFNSVNVVEIAKQLNNSGFTKGINLIGRPLVGRTGLETVEELGIFAGQNFITDTAILGRGADRETFLKGANETFWATVVTAGMSQSTGITYSGMNAYGMTKKYEKVLNKSNFALNDLSSSIQSLSDSKSDQEVKKLLLFQYQEELKAMGLAIDENSIDLLNISSENKDGASDLKTLVGTQLIKQDYLRSLGIQPGTNAQQDSAIEALKAKSTEQEKKDIETTLSSLDTQINNIKEKASKASNYDVAKKALGSIYTFYDNQLEGDTEYDAASPKNKLVKIINNVREDTRLQNIKNAKSNPFIVQQVESMYAGPGFASNKTKDTTYENLGANMALNQGRAYSTSLNVNIQASTIFGKDLKSVNVVGYENDTQIEEELKKAGLMPEEIITAIEKIKNNKAFGLVFGKTIFTQSPDLANKNLDNGEIQAGTVILHELTHITKDADMKSPESKKKYFDNLFLAASTSSNQALVGVHNNTVKLLGNKTEENKAKWEDEYSNILQEQLYYYEKEVQLEKDDSFITKIFGRANPANLNTPEKALDYLAASNSAFRKGKISNATQKSVENFEGSNLKGSTKPNVPVKNINKLVIGKTYDQLKNDPEFRRQYDNVAVKAMKFDQQLGNEINRKTVLGEAYVQLPSIIKNYKPVNEKGESQTFTNYVYQTLDPQKRTAAFYRKELGEIPTQKIGKMQLIGDEDADANIKREAREKLEGKGKSLIDPRKLSGVPTDIDNLIEVNKDEVVINPESRSYTTDFRSISDQYGSRIAGEIYDINPSKLKKGADLTYAQNKVVDRMKVISEAERIQSDYVNVQDAKKLISLFPEYSISTPTAITTEQGQETKVDKDIQGRSLGIAPSVLDFFYETYIDPKALNKETKKDAITNPKGRAKGTSSQPYVRRLKPEFMGNITNETIAKVQKKLGITGRGEFNIPPKGKARTEFGRLLIGLANLKGAIVANTIVDQKVKALIKKGEIKSAKAPEQITANITSGRNRLQFSENYQKVANTSSGVLSEKSKGYMTAKTVSELNDLGFKTVADIKKIYNLKLKDGDKTKLLKRGYSFAGLSLNEFAETPLVVGLNKFINDYPQYRDILRKSMTGSLQKGSMISTGVFDQVSPRLEVKIPFVLSRQ